MGAKTLAVIAIVIVIVVAFFILDTSSLLNPILDALSLRKTEATSKAVLKVDGFADKTERSYTIRYSVSNAGNATAQNVTLAAVVDGRQQTAEQIASLSAGDNANYSLVVSAAADELHIVSLQASCEDSFDAYWFSFGAEVPRTFSDNPNLVKLFVTPREPSLVALKDEVLKDAALKLKDWIALRNWVGNNIEYRHDEDIYAVREYWQFGKETVNLKTGDCEDFSILLVSLLRAAGYSADDVYVVIGKNAEGYHAWVKVNLDTLGWYDLEPQENGWATIVGDFITLSDFQALYQFNDQQFHQLS
jgi:transglutaminase-like putative cysteine protease